MKSSSIIELTRNNKNTLKKLIQITALFLIILTIMYLIIAAYIVYKTYLDPNAKITVPEITAPE